MRVLVITNDLPPRVGGIQYYVDQLCRGLVHAGDDVLVFGSTSDGASEYDEACPYRVIRRNTSVLLPGPMVQRHVMQVVRDFQPDVVVFGAAMPLGLLGPHIKARTGVPYIAFTHGLEVTAVRMPLGSVLLRRIGRKASAITYVSNWCSDMLSKAFGKGPKQVLLPPAIDDSEFNLQADGAEVRTRYGVSADDALVVCVSRLVERKGQDLLIDAIPEIQKVVPSARLLIVGDGPHSDSLKKKATDAGLCGTGSSNQSVMFTGQVSEEELAAHYAAGQLFAMPCRERQFGLEVEAFGIVFIQSQAVGVPVVAGDIGGVPDSLVDGETGVLVDSSDVAAIADAVSTLLADPGRLKTMGSAGADRVRAEFTWAGRTAQLRQLLADVVDA